MPKYSVLSPVDVGGVIYKSGELEAAADVVQPLIDSGSLKLADDQINFDSEAERLAKEKADKEAADKAEADRIAKEAADKAEADRLAKEAADKAEADRLAKEAAESATLVGAVTLDGKVVELKDMKVPELKKLATDMGVEGADQLKKETLVEAIKAVQVKAVEKI